MRPVTTGRLDARAVEASSSPFLLAEREQISEFISSLGHVRGYRDGQFIYEQGVPSPNFFEVVSGRVRIYLTRLDGAERVLSYAEPGASFAESTCFDSLPAYATGAAFGDCQIRVISGDAVISASRNRPEVMLEIARRLSRKQRLLGMHIAADGVPAQGRAAWLLSQLLDAYGSVQPHGGARFRVRHSVDELASIIGVTRVTMSRELSHLAADGIIAKDGRHIVVLDPARLRALMADYLA